MEKIMITFLTFLPLIMVAIVILFAGVVIIDDVRDSYKNHKPKRNRSCRHRHKHKHVY